VLAQAIGVGEKLITFIKMGCGRDENINVVTLKCDNEV
jgi:hypothetical protein